MICADCTQDAVWVHDDPGAVAVPYCDSCLPWFLRSRANVGNLTKAPEKVAPKAAKKVAASA